MFNSSSLESQLRIVLWGFLDSISLQRTLKLLVDDANIAKTTSQILVTNAFLLLGSILVFNRGISPLLYLVRDSVGSDNVLPPENTIDKIGWFIYQTFWLIPICLLCYGCSVSWYQELADSTYKNLKSLPKSTSISKAVGNAIYGTLVWLFIFLQVQVMVEITPMAGNQLQSLAKIFFQGLNASTGESLQGFNNIVHKLFCSFVTIVVSAIKFAGLVVMCLLYGWYGFDPRWIAAGLDVNQRFTILEKHWAYFVGFGIPYVLLVRNTTFFWGYGVFLAVFPFCILLGALSDYTKPYTENREADMPLPFFQLAKSFSLSMLKFVKTDQPRQKMSLDSGKKQKSAKAKHKKLN